jgi:hypothetical protein
VSSITLQLLATIPTWRQERINKWSIEIQLDMSKTNTYTKSFTTEEPYYSCFARFSMRGPVTNQFAKYRHIGGGNVPDELIRNMFSQMPFKVSWRLLDGKKEVCSGAFLSSDICAWVYPTYVYYAYSSYTQKGLGNLEPRKEYSFVGNVEQPCGALNELNPKLEFRRLGSYKMRGVANITLIVTATAFLLGLILLCIGVVKKRSQKNKIISEGI